MRISHPCWPKRQLSLPGLQTFAKLAAGAKTYRCPGEESATFTCRSFQTNPGGERSRRDCSDRFGAFLDSQQGQDLSLINQHLALSVVTCLPGRLLLQGRAGWERARPAGLNQSHTFPPLEYHGPSFVECHVLNAHLFARLETKLRIQALLRPSLPSMVPTAEQVCVNE